MPITYVKGSAVEPRGEGTKFLLHVVNDVGAWGKGFVLALSRRYPLAENYYRRWYHSKDKSFALGNVEFILVNREDRGNRIIVGNMIAQKGLRSRFNPVPLQYDALEKCLEQVREQAKYTIPKSIHMPRIGCGLAGGQWDKVETLLLKVLGDFDLIVYDL